MFVVPSFDFVTMTDLRIFKHRRRSSVLPRPMPSRRLRNNAGLNCTQVSSPGSSLLLDFMFVLFRNWLTRKP